MSYDRNRDIPRVLPVYRSDLGEDIVSRAQLVAKLEASIAAEKNRGPSHFAYSKPRLEMMVLYLEIEKEALADMWASEHAL